MQTLIIVALVGCALLAAVHIGRGVGRHVRSSATSTLCTPWPGSRPRSGEHRVTTPGPGTTKPMSGS